MSTNFGNYYDVSVVEAEQGFEPLPPGEYPAIAKEAGVVDTKDKTGKMVKVQFEIIDGEKKGRMIINNYNIINKNEIAANIGRSQLKALATACGKPNATDAAELLNVPVVLSVGLQKNNEKYNEVKSVKPFGQSFAPSGVPAKAEKPSWMK